jgi:hypothetical protein
MRYFHADPDSWGSKINFVDENNVLVGYDFSVTCCENFGWYVSDKVTTDLHDHLFNDTIQEGKDINQLLEGWTFDPAFFEKLSTSIDDYYDDDNRAVFRMIKGDQEQFLHLWNVHNGYYSHGFTFQQDDTTLQTGFL